ncbi:MAG TPA: hypothetical protein VGB20_02995 [bacterium]
MSETATLTQRDTRDVPASLFAAALPYESALFSWPMSMEEVEALKDAIERGLIRVLEECREPDLRTAAIVVLKWLLVEYLSLAQGCGLIARTRERGQRLVLSDEYPMLRGLAERGVPYGDGVAPLHLKRGRRTGPGTRIERIIRRVGRQAQWGGLRGMLTRRIDGPETVCVLAPNDLLRAELASRARAVYCLGPEALMTQARGEDPPKVTELGERLASMLAEVLSARGWKAGTPLREYVRALTERLLEQAARDLMNVTRRWERTWPRELWTGSGGHYWVRIARAVTRAQGGSVTGFDHGGSSAWALHQTRTLYYMDGLWADEFVAYTDAAASLYQRDAAEWPLGLRPPVVRGPAPGSRHPLRSLIMRERARAKPDRVRTVMYVPTVFRGEKQVNNLLLLDDMAYLDWQARLVGALCGAGFRVICKPHPEGLLKGRPLRYIDQCEFRYDAFESAWNDADAFVFDYLATTAFAHALCTRKPVVWVDHGRHPWHQDARALAARRCTIVPAAFDQNNRLQADFDRLAASLHGPVTEPDRALADSLLMNGARDV